MPARLTREEFLSTVQWKKGRPKKTEEENAAAREKGVRLSRLLNECGLKNVYFYQTCGIPKMTLTRYIVGSNPCPDWIMEMAEYLHLILVEDITGRIAEIRRKRTSSHRKPTKKQQ